MIPTTPAAASVCPRLLLADPTAHRFPLAPYTCAKLLNSIGSPTGVPVPCASIKPTLSASTPAAANAAR
ncbi:hypothetical protein MYBA111488_00590 [Mycobacterium basiliense]